MGGLGSGRYCGYGRPAVERTGALKLDIASIIRPTRPDLKGLQEGRPLIVRPVVSSWVMTDEEGACAQAEILLRLGTSGGTARLVYNPGVAGYPTGVRDYSIHLTAIRCRYGGWRWWWSCPSTSRRCRVLYLPAGGSLFLSRDAYGLRYSSSGEGVSARQWRIIRRVEKRLGIEPDEEVSRPRWMHHATCERLVDRYIAAEAVLDAGLCRTLARRGLADVPDEGAIF